VNLDERDVHLASAAIAVVGKTEGVGGWLELRHSSAFPRPSFSFLLIPSFVLPR